MTDTLAPPNRVYGPGVAPAVQTTAERISALVKDVLWPQWNTERDRLDRIDAWYRWDHGKPHMPRQATPEYQELSTRAQAPWGYLVVTTLAQELYVEGYRRADSEDNTKAWDYWQANAMDGRQIPLHKATLAYGLAYTSVLKGTDEFDDPVPVIRCHSPRRMMAFYGEPEMDTYPRYALQVRPRYEKGGNGGYHVWVWDDADRHYLTVDSMGTGVEYVSFQRHGIGFCPVIRYADDLDLEARSPGQVEPFIPLLGRIDQTTFDRLVVQRFASWVTRTIAGMAPPDNPDDEQRAKMLLTVADILVAENAETKFGSLPATPLGGFIAAGEADIKQLAAVSQTPAHELLGTLANMSAEALAAARAGLTAKGEQRKHTLGESHEQTLRVSAYVMGDEDGARDKSAQVVWADMEPRSLSQVADALGKLAAQLQIPEELLWEKVPGFTSQDIARAKDLRAKEPPEPVVPPMPSLNGANGAG